VSAIRGLLREEPRTGLTLRMGSAMISPWDKGPEFDCPKFRSGTKGPDPLSQVSLYGAALNN
jgi:hypothetical protein